jgi:hypothetical protein
VAGRGRSRSKRGRCYRGRLLSDHIAKDVTVDVKEQADMEEVVATVAAEFGGVDILCLRFLKTWRRQAASWSRHS